MSSELEKKIHDSRLRAETLKLRRAGTNYQHEACDEANRYHSQTE
jgi:hypothetical protein